MCIRDSIGAVSYAVSPDSTEAPSTRIRKPHISLHNRIRMDEALNLSGARFEKDAASVKGFIGFMRTKGRFVFKKCIYWLFQKISGFVWNLA